MTKKLRARAQTQGWKQFLTSRKELLDAYDRARTKARGHEVQVYHGKVAEAEFRKWLTSFLPKRYGVTSGYIVSSGLNSTTKTPHYDVIIYDQLDSPILWVEDYADVSNQGRCLAIPVEYVRCVLEVKSSFSSKTVDDAIEHLNDLLPLLNHLDSPQEKYKVHLPPLFCCGIVFYELRQDNKYNTSALKKLAEGVLIRVFFGGIILRGEEHTSEITGELSLLNGDSLDVSMFGKDKNSLFQTGLISSHVNLNGNQIITSLSWNEMNFSSFGFDLIARMQGTYEPGRLSSFYGHGCQQWESLQFGD
ncbi:DUF6602 domain-containing protein [Shewanella xiamenensis]|uniref:DUF6602 domain-containing protein n=1 Tax=Shewanella xiamenensis TaxID=332186 RepID=UPI002E7C017A|nr:DUF6602 domain-containing protein [Shewanella xiamenensis]